GAAVALGIKHPLDLELVAQLLLPLGEACEPVLRPWLLAEPPPEHELFIDEVEGEAGVGGECGQPGGKVLGSALLAALQPLLQFGAGELEDALGVVGSGAVEEHPRVPVLGAGRRTRLLFARRTGCRGDADATTREIRLRLPAFGTIGNGNLLQ